MGIEFYKYHGTGNDFILVDNRNNQFPHDNTLVKAMCDRHFGIGGDGLILLEKKEGYDFSMVYYNSDGNESTMCGNGGRCMLAFADFLSLISDEARFYAIDGEHSGRILSRQGNMWHITLRMQDVDGFDRGGSGMLINTGSPHLVRFSEDVAGMDVFSEGRKLRYSEPFRKDGVNVDFVELKGDTLFVRSYERGVENETLSCGTGVTASTLVYAAERNLDEGTVEIRTPGGRLSVSFRRKGDHFSDIYLSGPAEMVFHGTYYTN